MAGGNCKDSEFTLNERKGGGMATINDMDLMANFYGGAVPEEKSKKSSDPVPAPDELKATIDQVVVGRDQLKRLESALDMAEEKVKAFVRAAFCKDYVRTRKRPESVTFQGDTGTLNVAQTTGMTLNRAKVTALREIGFPAEEHVATGDLQIDFDAAKRLGLEKQILQAIMGTLTPEQRKEIVTEKLSARPSLLDAAARWADGNEEKLREVLEITGMKMQVRAAKGAGVVS